MPTPAMKQPQRRDDLRQQLGSLQPTLSHLYEHCLQILLRYDDNAPEGRATLAFLAHGVRELVNSIPDMLNTAVVSSRAQEQKALAKLRSELMTRDPIAIPHGSAEHVTIPLTVAVALRDYQQGLARGSDTSANRMAAVFLGGSSMRGGSLVAVQEAERFFMHWVHIDRSGGSTLPSRSEVQGAFEVIETSLLARLGDFFGAKERMKAFVDQTNKRDNDGSFADPDDDELRYGLSLAADPRLARLFYGWLENPSWMKKLIQHKALTDLSTPETTGQWFEYPYIVRMAPIVPEDVCIALSTVGPQSPPLVRSALLECAANMPAKYSARLTDRLLLWAGDDATLEDWCWEQEHLSRLFAVVLPNQQARKRGKRLLDSLYRPRPTSALDKDVPYYGHFASLIPSHMYAESLSDAMQWLSTRVQVGTLANYLQTIEAAWSYHGTVHTSFLIPSINDAAQGDSDDIGRQLAKLICRPLRTLLDTGDIAFEKRLLDCQRHLVQRAAMHVLAHAILESKDEEARRLCALADKAFRLPTILDGDYDPELFPLVRAAKQRNPDLSLHNLLSRLDEGASRRKKRFLKNQSSCGTNEEQEAKRIGRMWKHRVLSLIGKEHLDGDELQELLKLEEEFGSRDYDERHVSAIECSWGPVSPIGLDEMQVMGPEELLAYLTSSHFDAKDLFDMKSHRGQGYVLEELVQRQPNRFLGMTHEIASLRPTYISSILSGWVKAINGGMNVDLTTCVETCEHLSHIPDGEPFPAEGDSMDDDADYDSARLEAVRLLDALLSCKQAREIEGFRDRVLEILISFANSTLPEENDARDDGATVLDPALTSINGARTIAIQALSKWLYHFGDCPRRGKALVEIGSHLPTRSTSPGDAAAIGCSLPYLVASAEEWAKMHYSEILGDRQASTMQQIVLTTTLVYFPYSPRMFEYLRPALLAALEEGCEEYVLGHNDKKRDCPWLIGKWSMTSLLGGHISYSDEVFALWEKSAGPECQCGVLSELCHSIQNLEPPRLALTLRAAHVWDRLYDRAASPDTADSLQEALYRLITTGILPPEWWAPRLANTFVHGANWVRLTMLEDELTDLAKEHANKALRILREAAVVAPSRSGQLYALRRVSTAIIGSILLQDNDDLSEDIREVMSVLGRSGITDLDTSVKEYIANHHNVRDGAPNKATAHRSNSIT